MPPTISDIIQDAILAYAVLLVLYRVFRGWRDDDDCV